MQLTVVDVETSVVDDAVTWNVWAASDRRVVLLVELCAVRGQSAIVIIAVDEYIGVQSLFYSQKEANVTFEKRTDRNRVFFGSRINGELCTKRKNK